MGDSYNRLIETIEKLSSPEKQCSYIERCIKGVSIDDAVSMMSKFKSSKKYDLLIAAIDGSKDECLVSDKFKKVVLDMLKSAYLEISYPSRERENLLDKFIEFRGDVGEFCYEALCKGNTFGESEQAVVELYFSEIAKQNVDRVIWCFGKYSNDEKDPPEKVKEYLNQLAKILRIYELNKVIGPHLRKCYYDHLISGENIDKNIYIYGESGTGKTTLAGIIHENSGRSGGFVKVEQNLSKEEILEKISQAKDGTLFIDEVDRIDKEIQNDILTNLPEKGIVSASSRANPSQFTSEEMIKRWFELDFHRRIVKYSFEILPLRSEERKEDCKEAIKYFWKNRTAYIDLDEKVVNILSEYNWPQNLDQVKKVMEDIYTTKVERNHDSQKLYKDNLNKHLHNLPPDTQEIIRQIFSF